MTTPKPVDALFDIRTGYHVITKPAGWFDKHPLGEGNPSVFTIIRCDETTLPQFWKEPAVAGEVRTPLVKLDLPQHKAKQKTCSIAAPICNVYDREAAVWAEGRLDEYEALTRLFDALKNAVLTVGTGKTYATISAAIAASSSGDIIEVYDTTSHLYSETVNTSVKRLQIIGMYGVRGLTVKPTANHGFYIGGHSTLVQNFHVDMSAATNKCGFYPISVHNVFIVDCSAAGATAVGGCGFYGWNHYGAFINCLAYNNDLGFYSPQNLYAYHCTAAKNTTAGFKIANWTAAVELCIGAGNGADFTMSGGTDAGALNASSDLTAWGAGSVTGFLTSDFVDYTNNDFRLKASVKDTTKARFLGHPLCPLDAFGQSRKDDGIVFAGCHDPDPVTETVPGAPSWSADPTPGDAQVTLHVTAMDEDDVIYARWRSGGAWSAESETFKRTGSGDITVTGLVNGNRYDFAVYAKAGALTSDWSEPRNAVPVGAGQGTSWSPVLSKTSAYWEGVF